MPSPSANRLTALRSLLEQEGLDGLIIPHSDEYLGEYTPACAERLEWLTGFSGSAGLAIVLPEAAAVFSDGRYVTQMDQQVDKSCWSCEHMYQTPPNQWLADHAPKGARIGYDSRIMSQAELLPFQATAQTYNLSATDGNLVDRLWTDRPAFPAGPAVIHPFAYAGETSDSKRKRLAQGLKRAGQAAAVLSDSSSIAWLLNIRGADIPCLPVVLAFAVLHADTTVDLFIQGSKLPANVRDWLGETVRVHEPDAMEQVLAELKGHVVSVDPATNAVWFTETLTRHGATVQESPDPCLLPKALKNPTEQEGTRKAHLKDGIALCRFLHWLDQNALNTTELKAAAKLDAFRAEGADYRGESFPAISGSGPNGAVIHYRVTPESDRALTANEVYLIDSGGQYPEGTTDVTRTLWTGPDAPPASLKETFTRVLKGNLRLGRARFPKGTTGSALDTLARFDLWQAGQDYDHGTGHGVGSFLSVHEGPARISKIPNPIALDAGMILSNEPGYYEPGAYGIRLETLVLVHPMPHVEGARPGYEFETLTLAPFDRRLIDEQTLGQEDKTILDAYHARVLELVGPHLPPEAQKWLKTACAPLTAA
ncbi:aminopeptidase P family protein [Acetobacter sp.]|uniref:aminopeptidase P family protein n=1 Tax=Acetobacter sp. TaxID=440 RepID=UPI0039EB683E